MSSIQDSDLHGLDLTVFNNGQDPYPASDDTLKKTFIHPVQYYTDVVNKVGVPEHGRVLDLLCGVGRWSVFLAQSCSELVGIDRLTGCTNIAAGLCKHLGLTNTQFFDRDVSYVENFSDASFDVVWMYSALQYVDRAYTLRQAQRLLKPGGLLVVRNYNAIGLMVNHMLTGVLAGDTDQGSTRWAMNALAKGEQDDGSPNYVTTSGAPKLLHRFGFRLENVSVAEEFFTEAADFSSGVGNDTAHDGALAAACSKLANQFDPVVNFVAVKKDAAETVFDADSYLAEVAAGTLSHADVSELARLDPESAIRQLLGKLSSQDQLEQQNARAILVGLEEIAFQPLVDAAVKSDGTVKINAKNALLELAERNSGAIVRMLMQADEKTREFVLDLGNQHIMETAGKTNQDRIKVVVVLSLAYSGSTWTTLTVGSQRDAICLGGGDQIFDAAEGRYQYQCQLHGPSCRYWSENFKDYQNGDNLFCIWLLPLGSEFLLSIILLCRPLKIILNIRPSICILSILSAMAGRHWRVQ